MPQPPQPPKLSKADELCDLAKSHLKQRQLEQAKGCYEQALAVDNRHIAAHEGLATVSFLLKDYPKAAELYKRASLLNPRKVDPVVNLGAVLNRQEKFADAVRTLRSAITKDRKCAAAYYNLGIAYRGQNQANMAVSAYKEAIRLDPGMVDAYYNLGRTLMDMGNISQAILNFEKALQINAKFEKARHALDQARDQKLAAKKSANPFGRLVDMEAIANRLAAVKYRDLSTQERYEDRTIVHKLAKEAEQSAIAFYEQMKVQLEQAVLEISRQMTNKDLDPYTFGRAVEALDFATQQYETNRLLLKGKVDALRAHEATMRVS